MAKMKNSTHLRDRYQAAVKGVDGLRSQLKQFNYYGMGSDKMFAEVEGMLVSMICILEDPVRRSVNSLCDKLDEEEK